MLEKQLKKIPVSLARIYTLLIVMISFIIFNADSVTSMLQNIGGLFGINKVPLVSKESIYYLKSYFIMIVIGIIGSTPIIKNRISTQKANKWINCIEPIVLLFILIISTSYIIDGSFSPFLYFRF